MDKLEKIIKEFIRENYGESELEEPSYNIEKLAEYIVNNEDIIVLVK